MVRGLGGAAGCVPLPAPARRTVHAVSPQTASPTRFTGCVRTKARKARFGLGRTIRMREISPNVTPSEDLAEAPGTWTLMTLRQEPASRVTACHATVISEAVCGTGGQGRRRRRRAGRRVGTGTWQARLMELCRELRAVEMENVIRRRAAAYFARQKVPSD